ncbi:4951_t:CDS:2 [Cetraspora pellucida]|uniref:4951_t:CDS:1 n=1 Tax=Cetraspora pellucida TaxID=1433469 RepID=A0ACA9L395_9GLOM|nr:4951_t:CDS:2 [Cetraspora pellucida]
MEKFNKDDIYIKTYFEETSHCSKNLSNILTNAEPVSLKEVKTVKNEKKTRKQTILYKHSDLFKPKNNTRPSTLA